MPRASSGCRTAPSDQEAVRAGIQQHLKENGGLNLATMEVDIQQVTISRDRATAQVEFRLKQRGASMRIAYALDRKDGSWVVVRSEPAGAQIEHPRFREWEAPRL